MVRDWVLGYGGCYQGVGGLGWSRGRCRIIGETERKLRQTVFGSVVYGAGCRHGWFRMVSNFSRSLSERFTCRVFIL